MGRHGAIFAPAPPPRFTRCALNKSLPAILLGSQSADHLYHSPACLQNQAKRGELALREGPEKRCPTGRRRLSHFFQIPGFTWRLSIGRFLLSAGLFRHSPPRPAPQFAYAMGKKLGQHFLHSTAVLDSILIAAGPKAGEPVLEIGPGQGALTERLLETGATIRAVELDANLAEALRKRWGKHEGFQLIEGDVLQLPLTPPELFGNAAPYAVVANLPYYLSTPLLFRLASFREGFSRLVLMLQLEVAQRILASPAEGKAYGSLSIVIQHAFAVSLVRRVPPSAFRPPPKVSSAVLRFTPLQRHLTPEDERRFFHHVKTLFTRRRKRMFSVLKSMYGAASEETMARVVPIVSERRAETLSPEEHLEVFLLLHPEIKEPASSSAVQQPGGIRPQP